MTCNVVFHAYARADLFDLYTYIEERSGAIRAGGYTDRIVALCESLKSFPDRGTKRADLGVGVRTISLERRVLIAYRTRPSTIEILRILYAGRDFQSDDLPDETATP